MAVTYYYVHQRDGSNANAGSSSSDYGSVTASATAKKTLAGLKSAFSNLNTSSSNSAVVYISGEHVGGNTWLSQVNVTFKQWPGEPDGWVRNVRDPIDEGSTWALSSGTTYKVNIGSGKVASGGIPTNYYVTANWLLNVSVSTGHYGYYPEGTVSGGALTVDKRVFYDTATGDLYFRHDSIGDPATLTGGNRVMWADASLQAILALQNGTSVVVQDLKFRGALGGTANSWGIAIGGTSSGVRNCQVWDCDVHHIGVSSDPNVNCFVEDCYLSGCGRTTSFTSIVGHNNSSADNTRDVSGLRIRRTTIVLYSLLNHLGAEVSTGLYLDAGNCHTTPAVPPGSDGTTGTVDDMEWYRCTCTLASTVNKGGSVYAGATPVPSYANRYVIAAFPVRVIECTFSGATRFAVSASAAYVRCQIDLTRGDDNAAGQFIAASGHRVLVQDCVIAFKTGTGYPAGQGCFMVSTGAGLHLVDNTCANLSTTNTQPNIMISLQDGSASSFTIADKWSGAGGASWELTFGGNIFDFKTAPASGYQWFMGGDTSTPYASYSGIAFAANIYRNVDSTTFGGLWSGNFTDPDAGGPLHAPDTQLGFVEAIDPNALILTNATQVLDNIDDVAIATQGKPYQWQAGGYVSAHKTTRTTFGSQGYNRRPYGRAIGAWQDGGGAAAAGMIAGVWSAD